MKKEKIIAYKVVHKETRYGSNAALFMRDKNRYYESEAIFKEALEECSELRKFFPIYLKGKKIRRVKDSCGILCFLTIRDAENFLERYCGLSKITKIIKVTGILFKTGEEIRLIGNCGKIENLLRGKFQHVPPFGTITFKEVTILE